MALRGPREGTRSGSTGRSRNPYLSEGPRITTRSVNSLQQVHGGLDQRLSPDLDQALVPAHRALLPPARTKPVRSEFRSAPLLFHCRLPLLSEVSARTTDRQGFAARAAARGVCPPPLTAGSALDLPPTGSRPARLRAPPSRRLPLKGGVILGTDRKHPLHNKPVTLIGYRPRRTSRCPGKRPMDQRMLFIVDYLSDTKKGLCRHYGIRAHRRQVDRASDPRTGGTR